LGVLEVKKIRRILDRNEATTMLADIKETDHVNIKTSDEKCSRCRADIGSEEVPLLIWDGKNFDHMWIYCKKCTQEVLKG
jgi:hypothetical protein